MAGLKGKRAALYARVSTDDGTQDPEGQLFRLRQIAAGRELKIYKEYVDHASGKSLHRDAMQELLEDVQRGRVDVLLVLKIERLARNVSDALYILDSILSAGVVLIITEEGIDTSTPWGRAIYGIIAIIAELDRENIAERTRIGLARARAEGRVGGRPRRKLTEYQKEKARAILKENPDISQVQLAKHFKGISRTTLIPLLKEEGIL